MERTSESRQMTWILEGELRARSWKKCAQRSSCENPQRKIHVALCHRSAGPVRQGRINFPADAPVQDPADLTLTTGLNSGGGRSVCPRRQSASEPLSTSGGLKRPKARQHLGFDLLGLVRSRRFIREGTIDQNVESFSFEVEEKLVGLRESNVPGSVAIEGIVTFFLRARRMLNTGRRVLRHEVVKVEPLLLH